MHTHRVVDCVANVSTSAIPAYISSLTRTLILSDQVNFLIAAAGDYNIPVITVAEQYSIPVIAPRSPISSQYTCDGTMMDYPCYGAVARRKWKWLSGIMVRTQRW